MSNNGHWEGEVVDDYNYFGIIYKITHKPSGRMYIGKKQLFNSKKMRGCSRRCTDRQSKDFKLKCWKPSNWREYTGSSKTLNELIAKEGKDKFKFEIIEQCRSKSILHYTELKTLWEHDVMRAKFEDGTFIYFNNSIGSIKFKIC